MLGFIKDMVKQIGDAFPEPDLTDGALTISKSESQIEISFPPARERFYKLLFIHQEKVLYGVEDTAVVCSPRKFKICHHDDVRRAFFALGIEHYRKNIGYEGKTKKKQRTLTGLWLELKSGHIYLLVPCKIEELQEHLQMYSEILGVDAIPDSDEKPESVEFPLYAPSFEMPGIITMICIVIAILGVIYHILS